MRFLPYAGLALWLGLAGFPAAGKEAVVTLATDDLSRRFEVKEGVASGFLADLLTQVLAGAGYKPDFRVRPWVRCFEETRAGTVDGLFALYRNPERDETYLFTTVPLDVAEEYIYVRKGRRLDAVHWRELLKGRRIGIVNGTWHGQQFQEAEAQHLFAAVVSVNSYESLIDMLGAGRIDAAFATIDTMRDALDHAANAERIERTDPAIDSLPVYLAFTRRRDMTDARDGFDRELRKMKEDGRYEALRKRYGAAN